MLDNTNKKNPFSVPENYFQNFNAEIMNKLPEKENKNKKIVPLWKSITKWSAAAVVVTAISLFGVNYMNNSSPNETDALYATEQNEVSLENDYYEFIEDQAIRVAYNDAFFSDEL